MGHKAFETLVKEKFGSAGISVNGLQPWDIQIRDDRFYERVAREGSMGLGCSYMDGWYESKQLDETIRKLLCSNLSKKSVPPLQMIRLLFSSLVFNRQSQRRAYEVGEKHYDLGNDLFECMLDKRMAYSCGYWRNAKTLDEAQEAKLDLICRKLGVQPGQKILDIGCGWGSFLRFAAENYGAETVGITISKEQQEYVEQKCAGLPVTARFQDYRDLKDESFDYVVSVGQMEHVGAKNYRNYMNIVHRCLKDDGLFLLHTIGKDQTGYTSDPWIEKYIFPNGMIPSQVQMAKSSEGLFIMEDWHNFSADYDKTLMAWHENFVSHWDQLKMRYDERFYRMWEYYLLACAGAFRARNLQLWQVVYSKRGVPGGYLSLR